MRDEHDERLLGWPDRNAEPSSGLGEIANGTVGSLAITPEQVMKLARVMERTTGRIADAVQRMENCIETGRELFQGDGVHSRDVDMHLRTAALSIQSVSREIEEVAGAAVVLTTQSLAQMGKNLQKAVIEVAVAHGGHSRGSAEKTKPYTDNSSSHLACQE